MSGGRKVTSTYDFFSMTLTPESREFLFQLTLPVHDLPISFVLGVSAATFLMAHVATSLLLGHGPFPETFPQAKRVIAVGRIQPPGLGGSNSEHSTTL